MTYKLYYLNGRGYAEPTRQMFILAGQEFEDIRYSLEDWPNHKHETPFGQVPVLVVDGVKIAQSSAIGRYVAKKLGYAGKTDIEQALVDGLVDQFKDHVMAIKPYMAVALSGQTLQGKVEGDKEESFKTVYVPERDKFFGILTDLLKKNGSGYLVGDSLTWADIVIADHITFIQNLKSDALDPYPDVLALKARVHSIPALKKWIDERPVTAF